jgi:hypothetical protein
MKTIYSILSITLNTALEERISIGTLMSNGTESMFKFSSEKLLAIKSLLSSEKYNLVKNYLKSLENDIHDISLEKINTISQKNVEWTQFGYLSYLSNYASNLVQYSEPKIIDIEFTQNNFKRLFEKYIFTYAQDAEYSTSQLIVEQVKGNLYPKINTRVNLDITLDSSNFENLFAPIEVNFLGINGVPVAGQTIDFSKKHYFLENDVTRFVALTKVIELAENKRGQFYVLGREPENSDVKNHQLWEQIRDSDILEFVDADETGIVEEYMESHDVRPYFKK